MSITCRHLYQLTFYHKQRMTNVPFKFSTVMVRSKNQLEKTTKINLVRLTDSLGDVPIRCELFESNNLT